MTLNWLSGGSRGVGIATAIETWPSREAIGLAFRVHFGRAEAQHKKMTPRGCGEFVKPSAWEMTEMSSDFAKVAFHDETDSVLIAATRSGRPEAFGRLVSRHEARMFRVALNITRDRENAKDVVQQSFHKAFLNLKRFQQKAAFSTWLTRIVINEALMCLRRDRGRREVSFEEHFAERDSAYSVEIEDGGKNPEETYESAERTRILFGAIRKLSADFRSVLNLRLAECSLEESAEVLRIPVGTLKARLFRARRQLRALVEHSMTPTR